MSARRRRRSERNASPAANRGIPSTSTAFTEQESDCHIDYSFDRCPDCAGKLELLEEPVRVMQQVEVMARPIEVSEHRSRVLLCQVQKNIHCAAASRSPQSRLGGSAADRPDRLSQRGLSLFLQHHSQISAGRDMRHDQSRATANVCAKVADSLESAYEELWTALPAQWRLNVDETGHPENGERLWTWCFRAPLFTLFKIDPSRSSTCSWKLWGWSSRACWAAIT